MSNVHILGLQKVPRVRLFAYDVFFRKVVSWRYNVLKDLPLKKEVN